MIDHLGCKIADFGKSRTFYDAGLKSRGGISLPDCFCVTLGQEPSAEVVTSDHGEFDRLVDLGLVSITFIR